MLDVTATGAGTSAATATRLIEGLDEALDDNDGDDLGHRAAEQCRAGISKPSPSASMRTAATARSSIPCRRPTRRATMSHYAIVGGNTDNALQ